MIRIDGATPQNLTPSFDSGRAAAQAGTFKGERLQVMDTAKSVLADAAEEITMSHSEKADAKRLSERKVTPQRVGDVQKVEEIMKYLEQMHRAGDKEKLEDTAKRILSARRDGPGPREEARRGFEDVAEQYMALQLAAQRGEEQGVDPERLEQIHDAIAELEDDFGPRIRAGIAAAVGAGEFAQGAEGAMQFRETYRDIVLGESDLPKSFDKLIERHGLQDFPRVVPALIKSLGEDLSAMRPSRDSEHLQAILQDLYNLEVATTVLDQARALSETVAKAGRV